MCCTNLAAAAQSTPPATRDVPMAHQNAVLPRTGSDEPADTVIGPNSESTLEIPQAAKGCWEVTTDGPPDSFQYIKGPLIGGWVPMKKMLCFIETASRGFQITYETANAEIAGAASRGHSISDFQSHTEVIGSDGNGNFTLRSVTTARQSLGTIFGTVPYTTISQLECRFVAEKLVVQASSFSSCTGAPLLGCDGGPTSTSKVHLIFHRAPGKPPG